MRHDVQQLVPGQWEVSGEAVSFGPYPYNTGTACSSLLTFLFFCWCMVTRCAHDHLMYQYLGQMASEGETALTNGNCCCAAHCANVVPTLK